MSVTNGKKRESVRGKKTALGLTLTLLPTGAPNHGPKAGLPPRRENVKATRAKAKVTKSKARVTREKAKARTKERVKREEGLRLEEVTLNTLEPACPRLERQTGILVKPILQESVREEPNVTVGIHLFALIGARGLVLKAISALFFIEKNRRSPGELTLRPLRILKQRQKARLRQNLNLDRVCS